MLVTLLVIWVVAVPLLTVAGTYVLSGVLGSEGERDGETDAPEPLDPIIWSFATGAHGARACPRTVRPHVETMPLRPRGHASVRRIAH